MEGKKLPVVHCVEGTKGWELNERVEKALAGAVIMNKPSFGSPELADMLAPSGSLTAIPPHSTTTKPALSRLGRVCFRISSGQSAPLYAGAVIMNKPSFGSPELADMLAAEAAGQEDMEIEMVGICTDICGSFFPSIVSR